MLFGERKKKLKFFNGTVGKISSLEVSRLDNSQLISVFLPLSVQVHNPSYSGSHSSVVTAGCQSVNMCHHLERR